MGFTSIDNFINEVSSGKFWRADFTKTYGGGTAVAGNWNDTMQSNGTPAQYLHGNLVQNADFVTSSQPWVFGTNWVYTPATNLMTRTPNADYTTAFLSQTLRMTAGCYYMVVYTIVSGAAGTGLQVYLGGTAGTPRTTNATFREILLCGTTDKLICFKSPSATGGGTVDLVSVQPLCGSFVPYNDLTEGSLWHGGDQAPETKHLVNFGAFAQGASSVPSILMLVDYLGVYPRVRTDSAILQNISGCDSDTPCLVHDCQSDWNEQTVANTAHSNVVKVTEAVTGGSANTNCNKLQVTTSGAFTGVIGSKVVALSVATYDNYKYSRYVYAWVRSTINLAAGDICFSTDEHVNLGSSDDYNIPALTANTWTRVRLDVSATAITSKDLVISVGIKVLVNKAQAFSVYVDDVRWTNPDYVIQNGTFTGNATGWTMGSANWNYRSNDVERTANADLSTLSQTLLPVTQKCPYRVTFTIANRSAGTITVSLGGGTASPARSTDGVYEEIITCGTTNYSLVFTPDASFNGRIDDVICCPLIPRADETLATSGGGVRMFYEIDNALGNGANASVTTISYTNQAGVENHWSGATINNLLSDVAAHLPHSGVGAGKFGPFIPLQAGDYGIRSVDKLQFSVAQATADAAVDVVVCKVIASIPLTTLYVTAERDLMNMLPSLPRVRDGACLGFLVYSGAAFAAGVSFTGYLDFAWS